MPASILITRPAESARAFKQAVEARLSPECDIVLSPLLRIEQLACDPDIANARTLIFTSVHAVHAFVAVSNHRDLTCYTVGPATAKAARQAGFQPITGEGTGQALVDRIKSDMAPGPCFYLRGDHVAIDIADLLNRAGLETYSRVVYRQVPQLLTARATRLLSGSRPVIMPLFSPRSAEIVFENGPFNAPLGIIAMSENVAQRVPKGMVETCITASHPDQPAMLDAIFDLWRNANRLEGQDPAQ